MTEMRQTRSAEAKTKPAPALSTSLISAPNCARRGLMGTTATRGTVATRRSPNGALLRTHWISSNAYRATHALMILTSQIPQRSPVP